MSITLAHPANARIIAAAEGRAAEARAVLDQMFGYFTFEAPAAVTVEDAPAPEYDLVA